MMELAGETRSDARVASEGPALRGGKKRFLQGTIAGDRPPRYGCRGRLPSS